MRIALLVTAVVLSVFVPAVKADAPTKPDHSSILRFTNRFGTAHGCPVQPNLALTSAHVVDMSLEDPRDPLWPGRYQTVDEKTKGRYTPVIASDVVDLAVVVLSNPVPTPYVIAAHDPVPGDKIYWVAYDKSNDKVAGAPKYYDSVVTRVVAGVIFSRGQFQSGSSGGCVLNEANEVVGLVTWGQPTENMDEVGLAMSVTGDWISADELASIQASTQK